MSKARSPRDVCSTTMGISGISSLLATWGPKFRCLRRLLLLGRPDALTRLVQLRRDRLHLGGDAVERLLHAQVVADAVGATLGDEGLDVVVRLAGLAQLVADLVVGHLQVELVSDRFKDQLAPDRQRRLGRQALVQLLDRLSRQLEIGTRVDAKLLEAPREAVQ